MHKFYQLKERLEAEGWYVGWNHYCCQSCGWEDVPYVHEEGAFKGKDVDLDKVLFNHSQDCDVWIFDDEHTCTDCDGEGCETCDENGWILSDEEKQMYMVDGIYVCYYPEQTNGSLFCFSGTEDGVNNLKNILYILEELAIGFNWSGTKDQRIELIWD